jgi:RimJ/RimL family protein N-acetyltransferase
MQVKAAKSDMPLCNRLRLRDPALSLRPVDPLDDDFLIALNVQERGSAYRGLGLSDSLVAKMLAAHRDAEIEARADQFPFAEDLIICCNRHPIGRLAVTLEISDFGLCLRLIDPELSANMRGRGHGRTVLCGIIDSARAMKLARVTLTVFAAKVRAIKLFKHIGFRTQGGADDGMNLTMAYMLP